MKTDIKQMDTEVNLTPALVAHYTNQGRYARATLFVDSLQAMWLRLKRAVKSQR